MADFTTISFDLNVGNTGSPDYDAIGGAGTEGRWSDQNDQETTASASWPAMIRPAATEIVPYLYAFTADATGEGVYSGAGTTPATFDVGNYLQGRWNWDALGTFASAPIFTAYASGAHAAISRGDGSILGGHATDTGATARSYLKGNLFGRVSSAGAPAAGPAAAPTVTMGTTGSVSPVAGANWLAAGQGNWQGLMGDLDYITFPNTPAAEAADTQHIEVALFTGPNMTPGTLTSVVTLKYTWT